MLKSYIRNESETNQDELEGSKEEAISPEGVDCSQTSQMLQAPYINLWRNIKFIKIYNLFIYLKDMLSNQKDEI